MRYFECRIVCFREKCGWQFTLENFPISFQKKFFFKALDENLLIKATFDFDYYTGASVVCCIVIIHLCALYARVSLYEVVLGASFRYPRIKEAN